MTEKNIFPFVIMVAILSVAGLFFRKVLRYRRRLKDKGVSQDPADAAVLGFTPPQVTDADRYMLRFICLLRLPFRSSKTVKIRPEYYERIRDITRVIGRREETITAYVDKVLKAHLDDNRESIDLLYEQFRRTEAEQTDFKV